MESLRYGGETLKILDQRLLPNRLEYVECRDWRSVADCIREMAVRGAPAIGVAAAFGLALSAAESAGKETEDFFFDLEEAACGLIKTRPTAVNLKWAVQRMMNVARTQYGQATSFVAEVLAAEAKRIAEDDIAVNRCIGNHGAVLVPDGSNILTHCNAGTLATVGYGTALGIVRSAVDKGKKVHVFADETRPYLQGGRLTTWELLQENIPVTLIADNMAGFLMKQKKIDLVIVGADRIAANGDAANKIGTYSVAVLAHAHQIPFYVAAPLSTFDMSLTCGDEIPIEERCWTEITHFAGVQVAPEGITCYNPSFDVTPANLISGIITEHGVIYKPDINKISAVFK